MENQIYITGIDRATFKILVREALEDSQQNSFEEEDLDDESFEKALAELDNAVLLLPQQGDHSLALPDSTVKADMHTIYSSKPSAKTDLLASKESVKKALSMNQNKNQLKLSSDSLSALPQEQTVDPSFKKKPVTENVKGKKMSAKNHSNEPSAPDAGKNVFTDTGKPFTWAYSSFTYRICVSIPRMV